MATIAASKRLDGATTRLLQLHATMTLTWQWQSPLVPARLAVPGKGSMFCNLCIRL